MGRMLRLALTSFNITQERLSRPNAESTNCVRTCACICARARGIRYREFGIYERNDRPRDSVINTELVYAFSCEFTSVPR